jgi:uncharacterized RDD family membrane protein YckC
MDSKIDFSSYSLDDLYSSAESIDRDMYPERAKEIDDLIRKREAEHPEEIDTTKNIGEKSTKTDRLLAALIDGVIAVMAMIPLFYYVGLASFEDPTISLIFGTFIYGVFLTFTLHGYLIHYYGQTIGKHFMSIRIENLDGTKASFSTIYVKRMLPMQLIGLVPSVGQFISGFINPIFIFGKQRRCLHDYVAKTKVSYTGT